MVVLFKPYHVPMILEGRKTETRRVWKTCRVRLGNSYQARTKLFDKGSTFARLKVLRINKERLLDITNESAINEGYSSREAFLDAFYTINGKQDSNPEVFAILFTVVP